MKSILIAAAITACLTLVVQAEPNKDSRKARESDSKGKTEDLRPEVKRAFNRADKDKDGSLSKDEFSKAAPNIATEAMIKERLAHLDANKDGSLGLDEFKPWDEKALKNEVARTKERKRNGETATPDTPRNPDGPPPHGPTHKPSGPPAAE